MRGHALLMALVLAFAPLARAADAPAPADPNLWLEDVTGEKALAWVRERNAVSAKELAETRSRSSRPRSWRSSTPTSASPTSARSASTTTTSGGTRRTRAACGGAPRWPSTARPSPRGRP